MEMRTIRRLLARIQNFSTDRSSDERLREEMESHLEAQTEDNIRAGMSPEEARRQARLKFGGPKRIREKCHAEERLAVPGAPDPGRAPRAPATCPCRLSSADRFPVP